MEKKYTRTTKDGRTETYNGILIKDGCQIINPTHDQLVEAGYTPYQPTQEERLAEAREEKIQQIKAYNDSEQINHFTIHGQQLWITFDQRQRIRASIQSYRTLGQTEMTKYLNGHKFQYPIEQWEQMIATLGIYASECLNTTEQHTAAVSKLQTIEEINQYDHTKGYPQPLSF